MAAHHGLLHGMQDGACCTRRWRGQIFNAKQCLAVQCGQELQTGIDGAQPQAEHAGGVLWRSQFAYDDRTSTTVAFIAAFFGAGAMRVFTQPVEHAQGGCNAIYFNQRASVKETNRTGIWRHTANVRGWNILSEC